MCGVCCECEGVVCVRCVVGVVVCVGCVCLWCVCWGGVCGCECACVESYGVRICDVVGVFVGCV